MRLLLAVSFALPLAALDATLTLDLRGVKGPTASLHVPGRATGTFTLPVLKHRRSGDAWFEGEWRLDPLLAALAADRVEFLDISLIAPPGGQEERITDLKPVGRNDVAGRDVTHWGRVAVKPDARHAIRYELGWRTMPWGIWAWLALPLIVVWCLLHPSGWLWQTVAVSAVWACVGQTETWQALRFLGHVPTTAGSFLRPAMGPTHSFPLLLILIGGMLGARFRRTQAFIPVLALAFPPAPLPQSGPESWAPYAVAAVYVVTGGIVLWSILRRPREKNPTRLPDLERAIEAQTQEREWLIAVDDHARLPSGFDYATPIPRSWPERMTQPELVAMTRLLRHKGMAEPFAMIAVTIGLVLWNEPRAFFLAPLLSILAIVPARRWSYAPLLRDLARTDAAALLSGLDKASRDFPDTLNWMWKAAAKTAAAPERAW